MGKKIVVITSSPRKNGNSFAMTGRLYPGSPGHGPHHHPV